MVSMPGFDACRKALDSGKSFHRTQPTRGGKRRTESLRTDQGCVVTWGTPTLREEQGDRATAVVVRVTSHLSAEEISAQGEGLQGRFSQRKVGLDEPEDLSSRRASWRATMRRKVPVGFGKGPLETGLFSCVCTRESIPRWRPTSCRSASVQKSERTHTRANLAASARKVGSVEGTLRTPRAFAGGALSILSYTKRLNHSTVRRSRSTRCLGVPASGQSIKWLTPG
jgi:hypothetical protein